MPKYLNEEKRKTERYQSIAFVQRLTPPQCRLSHINHTRSYRVVNLMSSLLSSCCGVSSIGVRLSSSACLHTAFVFAVTMLGPPTATVIRSIVKTTSKDATTAKAIGPLVPSRTRPPSTSSPIRMPDHHDVLVVLDRGDVFHLHHIAHALLILAGVHVLGHHVWIKATTIWTESTTSWVSVVTAHPARHMVHATSWHVRRHMAWHHVVSQVRHTTVSEEGNHRHLCEAIVDQISL